jgi:hypothetical protein
MTQHPKRCETCRHYESGGQWCIQAKTRLSQLEIELVALVGCASHSSATESAPDLSHIREDRRGCLNCLNPDCPVWQTADQNCWKSQKEHDAATKQAAREEVIQQFIDFGMSGKCVKTDKAVSCDAICERDCFVCFAESLRGGDAP